MTVATRSVSLLACLAALVPLSVLAADLDDCADTSSECREDCLLQFGGSVRVEMKRKYEKCVKKCSKKATLCRERVIETRNNALEDGALDRSPGSDEVDEHGMPTRTTATRGSADDTERQTVDDLRDDLPAPAQKRPAEDDAEPKPRVKPKEALREDEVPRSTRTQLKVEPSREEPASTRTRVDTAEPAREEPASSRTRLDKVEPSRDEPASTRTGPEKVEPSRTEPASTRTGPEKVEPAKNEPASRSKTEPAEPATRPTGDSRVTNEVKPPREQAPVRVEPRPSRSTPDLPPEPARTDGRRPLDEDLRDDLPAKPTKREESKKRDEKKREPPREEGPRRPLDEEDLRNF